MNLIEGNIYHVFNRGNNRQEIFLKTENYSYFLSKMEKYLIPNCDLLAWCLMPNHFHFLIYANSNSVQVIKDASFERQSFSQGVKMLLSSYTKAINKQEERTGSLFQQKTKSVCVSGSHAETAFHYIHQNPMKAGLVKKMEDWEFSSFKDYLNHITKSLCNRSIADHHLQINFGQLYYESYKAIQLDPNF